MKQGRKERGEEQEERRQEEQGQNTGEEQASKASECVSAKRETRAGSADEPEVTGGLAEIRTGRGSAGLIRGEMRGVGQTRPAEKAKERVMEGMGEHGSKGGAGSKGTQQVENSVMNEDQVNMRAMKSEEEEENHRGGCEEVGRDDAERGRKAAGPSGA